MAFDGHPVQFRSLPEGPEAVLQQHVEKNLSELFPTNETISWSAASPTLGAGRPDILHTSCKPELFALPHTSPKAKSLLGYLRAISRANAKTIAARIGLTLSDVEEMLDDLTKAKIVEPRNGGYSISHQWRTVLPNVVAIEVKVSNWRKAMQQANRNKLFSHRSYVALPAKLAHKMKSQLDFKNNGIGLICIEDSGEVLVARRAKATTPKVWSYYYSLAFLAAEHVDRSRFDLPITNNRRPSAVS